MTADKLVEATGGLLPLKAANQYVIYQRVTRSFVVFAIAGSIFGGLILPLILPMAIIYSIYVGGLFAFVVAWQVAWSKGAQVLADGFEPRISRGSRGLFVSLSKGPDRYVRVFHEMFKEDPPKVKN